MDITSTCSADLYDISRREPSRCASNLKQPSAPKMKIRPCIRGHQRGARGHQVAHKDDVGRPRACSKNDISMINAFTLTNINTKIIESKLSKIFFSEVYIKLVALRINRYTRSSSQFQKGW